ncbi:OmpP1/FadL family transporter [Bacteroides propionicifaciens]|uniref:OmpP1/FadL family transporter n=1 Tax=Bacteroides propionicifaciens TaxID=392838 RepID=UPI00037F5FE7|nr:outer membrane protein transport protein [Bacteroides propionicifaciens]
MKKYIVAAGLVLMSFLNLKAQSIYDAELFANKELSGTARFVGMGGAMGALGADISTMGVNPAGIGLYRSNDFNIGFGYTNTEIKSDYLGDKFTQDKNRFNMPNLGFVISTQMGYSGLKYLNFGFNYTRAKDFNSNLKVGGLVNRTADGHVISISDFMGKQAADMFNGGSGPNVADLINDNEPVYRYTDIGWMGALGYAGGFIQAVDGGSGFQSYLPQPSSDFRSSARGGIDQYDFNVSGNVSDRFFFGLTIGAYDLNYRRNTYYLEDYGYNQYGLLETNREVDGSGVDFKFGAIFRPIESSPFRIGLAIHTPIFYNLKQYTNSFVETQISLSGHDEATLADRRSVNPNELNLDGYDYQFNYDLQTPWKFNFSLGHNIGDFLAIGAEYELQDFSSMKFRYDDGGGSIVDYKNNASDLKTVHTVRLGLEYRIVPEFAFRAGYNYQTAAFNKNAYNYVPTNSTQTDIQFANNKDRNTFTMGLGYAGKMFYADLGFKFDWYKSDFRPFDDTELNFTKLTTNRSQILLTLGMRL